MTKVFTTRALFREAARKTLRTEDALAQHLRPFGVRNPCAPRPPQCRRVPFSLLPRPLLRHVVPRPMVSPLAVVGSYPGTNVTLADLADHTSGLPREPPCGARSWCSGDENLRMLKFQSLKWAPGTQASYSNLAVGLLGHAVAAAAAPSPAASAHSTGGAAAHGAAASYERYLVANVLERHNMSRSGASLGVPGTRICTRVSVA